MNGFNISKPLAFLLMGMLYAPSSLGIIEIPAEDLELDFESLMDVGAQKTLQGTVERVRVLHDIVVLELPVEHGAFPENYSKEAWTYWGFSGITEIEATYLPAYAPTVPSEVGARVKGYRSRPYGNRDLILYRWDSLRYVILHELTHYLIAKERQRLSGLGPKQWAERANETLFGWRRLFQKKTTTADEWKHSLEALIFEHNGRLNEEVFVHQTLLDRRKELGLSVCELQEIVLRIWGDSSRFFAEARGAVSESVEAAEKQGVIIPPKVVERLNKRINRLQRNAERRMKDFFEVNADYRTLLELGRQDVYLTDPEYYSPSSTRILGIDPYDPDLVLDPSTIRKVHAFWLRYYDGQIPSGYASRIDAAKNLLLARGAQMNCAAALRNYGVVPLKSRVFRNTSRRID